MYAGDDERNVSISRISLAIEIMILKLTNETTESTHSDHASPPE